MSQIQTNEFTMMGASFKCAPQQGLWPNVKFNDAQAHVLCNVHVHACTSLNIGNSVVQDQ